MQFLGMQSPLFLVLVVDVVIVIVTFLVRSPAQSNTTKQTPIGEALRILIDKDTITGFGELSSEWDFARLHRVWNCPFEVLNRYVAMGLEIE